MEFRSSSTTEHADLACFEKNHLFSLPSKKEKERRSRRRREEGRERERERERERKR